MVKDFSNMKNEKILNMRLFPLLLIILLVITVSGTLFLLKLFQDKKKLRSQVFVKFNNLKQLSARELFLYEKQSKIEELRWRDGWSISGNQYTFTDINGLCYTHIDKKE